MPEIILSINVETFEEVQERIKKVEPFVSWCHIDVTDGVFSPHPTWHEPADLLLLSTKLNVEVHLMINEPEKVIDQWLVYPVKRVIVHIEATKDLDYIIRASHRANVQVGIAINPDTGWGEIEYWYERVDLILILGVYPGPSGQAMHGLTIEKIKHVRTFCNQCIIEVDGGVNFDTASRAIEAGANILTAASIIFSSADIKKTIEKLKRVD